MHLSSTSLKAFTACLLLTSCVTIGRHEELEARVVKLERAHRDVLEAAKRDETRFQNLAQQIKDATDDLRKQAAAIAAAGEATQSDIKKVQGRAEELDHLAGRLSAEMDVVKKFLDSRFGLTVTPLPADLPSDPKELYDYGEKRLTAGQYELARAVFRHFLRHHESHELADSAELQIGESYHKQRRWQQALKSYGRIYEKYAGRSSRNMPAIVAKALLLAGQALNDGGNCDKAREMYRLLVRTMRKSPEAETAKTRLKTKCQ